MRYMLAACLFVLPNGRHSSRAFYASQIDPLDKTLCVMQRLSYARPPRYYQRLWRLCAGRKRLWRSYRDGEFVENQKIDTA